MPKDGEPFWLPEDTEAALAWQAYQDDLCECGQPRTESMTPRLHGPDYEAKALRCRACEAREAKARQLDRAKADMSGVKLAVLPRGGDE